MLPIKCVACCSNGILHCLSDIVARMKVFLNGFIFPVGIFSDFFKSLKNDEYGMDAARYLY